MEPYPQIDAVSAKIQALGIALPRGSIRVDKYGDSEELSQKLLQLIREGKKRAGTGLLWAHEADNDTLPAVGDIEIVLDYGDEPAFVTRVLSVDVLPFMDVTAEFAAIEGEGDGSLRHWRKVHWDFFSRECQRIGREPLETMPVVCSVFEVLNVLRSRLTQIRTFKWLFAAWAVGGCHDNRGHKEHV